MAYDYRVFACDREGVWFFVGYWSEEIHAEGSDERAGFLRMVGTYPEVHIWVGETQIAAGQYHDGHGELWR